MFVIFCNLYSSCYCYREEESSADVLTLPQWSKILTWFEKTKGQIHDCLIWRRIHKPTQLNSQFWFPGLGGCHQKLLDRWWPLPSNRPRCKKSILENKHRMYQRYTLWGIKFEIYLPIYVCCLTFLDDNVEYFYCNFHWKLPLSPLGPNFPTKKLRPPNLWPRLWIGCGPGLPALIIALPPPIFTHTC